MWQRLLRISRTDQLVILLTLVFFGALLSYIVSQYPTPKADVTITQFLQNKHFLFLTPFMVAVSALGEIPCVLYAAVFFMVIFMWQRLPLAASFVVVTFINYPVNHIVKLFIHRPRPVDDTLIIVFKQLQGYSFPSGHVTHYVVFYGFILFVFLHARSLSKTLRGIGILVSALLIVSIGPSRIFLGAHWFTDVLGGYILGGLILLPLIAFYHKLIPSSTSVQGRARKSRGR